nr:reverse transcriptase domain-containing protein [Tanacetum cinerariifolium]
MDDEPMWAFDRVVASALGSAIIIPETANEFAIKDSSNSDTDQIMARMDAMTIKMDAQYKKLQSRAKQPTLNLNDDDMHMSREEEAKFMQTFHKTRFYNDYRDRDSNRDNWRSSRRNDYNRNNYQSNTDDKPVGTERMISNIDSAMKHSYSNDDTCFSIDEILEEDFDALLDEGSKILHSIEGTLLKEEIFSEFIVITADENSKSESDTEEPPFEKITINTNYKIKTSLEEPPTDLELKPLPDNLEYIFLEEPSFLPVIISSQLSAKNKSKFVSILKNIRKLLLGKRHTFLVSVRYSANTSYNF